MTREPLLRLAWRGQETIDAIPQLLNEVKQIEIALPVNYNHALFRKLNPDASAAELEELDASGGPELLADIAAVRGLEELAILSEMLSAAHVSVRLVSPPMLVFSIPVSESKKE